MNFKIALLVSVSCSAWAQSRQARSTLLPRLPPRGGSTVLVVPAVPPISAMPVSKNIPEVPIPKTVSPTNEAKSEFLPFPTQQAQEQNVGNPNTPNPNSANPSVKDLETIFLEQAFESLTRGQCEKFLPGLSDFSAMEPQSVRAGKARIVAARCLQIEMRPSKAMMEYRAYLEAFPQGEFVLEARNALGQE